MGCDIHSYAERRRADGTWETIPGFSPFDGRNYSVFAFLAGVRNYSAIMPISLPRGFPPDTSQPVPRDYGKHPYLHSASWLSIAELLAFNYDAPCEDRRINGETCEAGKGKKMTLREFLGPLFFFDLDALKEFGAERIVFFFDN